MNNIDSKKLSDTLVLDLKGLQKGRMTLVVSKSIELNELLISTVLGNNILGIKEINHMSSFSGSFEDLLTLCSENKKTKGLDILAISEIKYFHNDDNFSSREHMSELSRNLKHLSKELNCHVIIGLTINSFIKDQMTFNKLREVGWLEADADMILFVERMEELIQVNVVKNRLEGLSKIIV